MVAVCRCALDWSNRPTIPIGRGGLPWPSGQPSASSRPGPPRCARMSWPTRSWPASADPLRACTNHERGGRVDSLDMRDLFDDFLAELRKREAAARGRVEDPKVVGDDAATGAEDEPASDDEPAESADDDSP